MKYRQASPDEAIDRVLTGLREVHPPPEMQQRLLRAATDHANAQRQSTLQRLFANRFTSMVAAGSVAVIAVAATWTVARVHHAAQIAQQAPTHLAPVAVPAMETRLASAPISQQRPMAGPGRPPVEEHAGPAETATEDDSLAVSEMNALSQPAPPMPLTEQERLLIRILDKGDPIELAMLDPGVRNNQETGDKVDFERFFKQPPKVVEFKLPLPNKPSTGD